MVRQKGTSSRRSFDLVSLGPDSFLAKDRSIATKTINAMSETAAEKPALRDALRLRRWESWADPAGDIVESCTILTSAPNALVADVHNRMPVIPRVEDYARWPDPSINNPSLVRPCLKPYDPPLMKKYPVSTRVNRPDNDDHECTKEDPWQ